MRTFKVKVREGWVNHQTLYVKADSQREAWKYVIHEQPFDIAPMGWINRIHISEVKTRNTADYKDMQWIAVIGWLFAFAIFIMLCLA